MNILKYIDLFEGKYRNEAEKEDYFYSFKLEVIKSNNPLYTKMSEIIRDAEVDENSAYKFTVEALEAIKEELQNNDSEVGEDMEFLDQQAEAPIYNNELTNWMGKASNYSFVEDAINEFGWEGVGKSILTAIQIGYSEAWKQQYYKVLEAVKA